MSWFNTSREFYFAAWQIVYGPSRQPLPENTCTEIVKYLLGDHQALAACSLTCRAWLSPARAHLFRRISMNRRRYNALAWFLGDCTFAHHVRDLSLLGYPDGAWLPAALPALLRRMTSVESLTIDYWHPSSIHRSLRRALPTLFPQVETMRLTCCKFDASDFVTVVRACPRLKGLHVKSTNITDSKRASAEKIKRSASIGRARLETVTWTTSSTVTGAAYTLQGVVDFRELRSLEISWMEVPNLVDARDLIRAAGAALEHLTLHVARFESMHGVALDLSTNIHLISLTLCGVQTSTRATRNRIDPVHFALSQILPSHTRLLKVTIGVDAFTPANLPSLSWLDIDENLTRIAHDHPDIVVTVDVHCRQSRGSGREAADVILHRLPRSHAVGARLRIAHAADYWTKQCVMFDSASGDPVQ